MPRRLVWTTALILPIIWCLPVISGYLASSPPDRIFLGWIRSDDFHRYGSFIEQTARQHRFLYLDYSTTDRQSPRMIVLYFTVLGIFKIISGISSQNLWLISGFLVISIFILYLAAFISRMFDNSRVRITAFLLVLFSTGFESLGYRIIADLPRPKNFWMDGFSTFDSFHNPLKIAGILLGLMLIECQLKILRFGKFRNWAVAFSLVLLLWAVHPNSAIPFYCSIMSLAFLPLEGHSLIKGLALRWIRLWPYVIPLAAVLGYLEWMQTDPMTSNIIQQYHVPHSMEPYWTYPIRYGLILPFTTVGIFRVFRKKEPLHVMMLGWLAGAELFAHLPSMTGLLFQHMVHIPAAILAAAPMFDFVSKFKGRFLRSTVIAVIGIPCITGDVWTIVKVCRQTAEDVWPTSLYASRSELNVMKILRDLPEGNVLVNRDTGNKIGWLALHNVFLGHWGTTPQKGTKEKELAKFYDTQTAINWRLEFLMKYRIRYIWYGPREQKLGPFPAGIPAKAVATDGDTALYLLEY
jgi:hypothetical protein